MRSTLIIAELHEQCLIVKPLDHRADLPACKSLRGNLRQQRHSSKRDGSLLRASFFARIIAPNT